MPKATPSAEQGLTKRHEILGIVFATMALLQFMGLISYAPDDPHPFHPNLGKPVPENLVGAVGATSATGLFWLMGAGAYLVPLGLGVWAWRCFSHTSVRISVPTVAGWMIMIVFASTLCALSFRGVPALGNDGVRLVEEVRGGGIIGSSFAAVLGTYFAAAGALIIVIAGLLLSIPLALPVSLGSIGRRTAGMVHWIGAHFPAKMPMRPQSRAERYIQEDSLTSLPELLPVQTLPIEARDHGTIRNGEPQLQQGVHVGSGVVFSLPSPYELLTDPPVASVHHRDEQSRERARLLVQACKSFGVDGTVTAIHAGPVLTMYEFEPAPGVKVSRIVNLSNDLALALKAETVRIVAPIPGKSVVGIEIPSPAREDVYLKDVLTGEAYHRTSWKLKLVLGKDIFGAPVVVDLQAMPHLLMAGATGSGKSVGLNSMITSLLFSATPHELQFLMIDPKMLELQGYNGIPHLLRPVITNAKAAAKELLWTVREMERRYQVMAEVSARNIDHYNRIIAETSPMEAERLPYIVVIIDELGDLMMVASREVEEAITRLAQMARASGIHLILATQRPSVDVLTGLIKANFPSRLAFKVSSKTDSRTILDANGAELLLGRGDMLFIPAGTGRMIRIHGAYVPEQDLQRVVEFLQAQGSSPITQTIFPPEMKESDPDDSGGDELYERAKYLVLETGQASASLIQRRLRVGYPRAARMIEMMEADGIVGPPLRDGRREVIARRVVGNSE